MPGTLDHVGVRTSRRVIQRYWCFGFCTLCALIMLCSIILMLVILLPRRQLWWYRCSTYRSHWRWGGWWMWWLASLLEAVWGPTWRDCHYQLFTYVPSTSLRYVVYHAFSGTHSEVFSFLLRLWVRWTPYLFTNMVVFSVKFADGSFELQNQLSVKIYHAQSVFPAG